MPRTRKLPFVVTVTQRALVVEMHDEGGWNFFEIADHFGLNYMAVESIFRKAKKVMNSKKKVVDIQKAA